MVRFILLSILLTFVLRAANRLWSGIIRGMQGESAGSGRVRSSASTPQRSVHMARDPICGTFVVPERAVTLTTGQGPVHFCSTDCRDKYRASAHAGSASVHGRTA